MMSSGPVLVKALTFQTSSEMTKRLQHRVQINLSWFGKNNTVFIFGDTVFPHLPRKSQHQNKIVFFHKPRKAKLFITATVKNNFNTAMSLFMKADLLLLNVYMNCLDTRLFSYINWSQFFSFSFRFSSKFAYTNIRFSHDFYFW